MIDDIKCPHCKYKFDGDSLENAYTKLKGKVGIRKEKVSIRCPMCSKLLVVTARIDSYIPYIGIYCVEKKESRL